MQGDAVETARDCSAPVGFVRRKVLDSDCSAMRLGEGDYFFGDFTFIESASFGFSNEPQSAGVAGAAEILASFGGTSLRQEGLSKARLITQLLASAFPKCCNDRGHGKAA